MRHKDHWGLLGLIPGGTSANLSPDRLFPPTPWLFCIAQCSLRRWRMGQCEQAQGQNLHGGRSSSACSGFTFPTGSRAVPFSFPPWGWRTWPPRGIPQGQGCSSCAPAPGKGGGGCCPPFCCRCRQLGHGDTAEAGTTPKPARGPPTALCTVRKPPRRRRDPQGPGSFGSDSLECGAGPRGSAPSEPVLAGAWLAGDMNSFPGKVPLRTGKGRSTRLWESPLGIWGGICWCRNASGQVGVSWLRPFTLLLPRWLLFAFRKRALVDGQKRGWDWAGDL